jgi:hypothetical protein
MRRRGSVPRKLPLLREGKLLGCKGMGKGKSRGQVEGNDSGANGRIEADCGRRGIAEC